MHAKGERGRNGSITIALLGGLGWGENHRRFIILAFLGLPNWGGMAT